jgi:undecaprenyl-diphosphatase
MKTQRLARDLRPVGAAAAAALSGYVVLCLAAIGLGWFVTHVVADGAVGRGDADIARWIAEHRTPLRNDLSLVGSYLAETVTVLSIILVVLVTLALRREWPFVAFVAMTMALEGAVYLAVTAAVTRDRPSVPRLEDLIVSDSFPSGHTAAAVALYGSLAVVVCAKTRRPAWRGAALTTAVVAPVVVASARVYRGMHYPTDVISGALIGAACVVVGYLAVRIALRVAEPAA